MNFMTPFDPVQGHFSVQTTGADHDDALTGVLTCRFDRDTLTITSFEVPDMFITAVLHPGTDQDMFLPLMIENRFRKARFFFPCLIAAP